MVIFYQNFINFNGNYTVESIENLIKYYGYFINDFERAESYTLKKLVRYSEYLGEIREG